MTTTDDAPGIGHNQPPPEAALDQARELVATANRWIIERPRIEDADMAGRCNDFVSQLLASQQKLGEQKKAEEEPLKLALDVIAARYREPVELLKTAIKLLRERAADWLKREDARLKEEKRKQEEEARRLREASLAKVAEAAEAQMTTGANYLETQRAADLLAEQARKAQRLAEKATPTAAARGDFAPKAMSLRTHWRARVVDPKAALKHYAKNARVAEAALAMALKIANEEARALKDATKAPPGFEFYADQTAV